MITDLKLYLSLEFHIWKRINNYLHKRVATAFTLAEVLITLLIIGVVVSMTIPVLINDTNKKETVVTLQKVYSDLSQATKLLLFDYAGDLSNGPFGVGNNITGMNEFIPKLNVAKNCSTGCGGSVTIAYLDAGLTDDLFIYQDGSTVILNNGIAIRYSDYNNKCTSSKGTGPLHYVCGYFTVDLNANKRPNMLGRDIFIFWLTKTGTFAVGCSNSTYFWQNRCNVGDGESCAAKVLNEGSINY